MFAHRKRSLRPGARSRPRISPILTLPVMIAGVNYPHTFKIVSFSPSLSFNWFLMTVSIWFLQQNSNDLSFSVPLQNNAPVQGSISRVAVNSAVHSVPICNKAIIISVTRMYCTWTSTAASLLFVVAFGLFMKVCLSTSILVRYTIALVVVSLFSQSSWRRCASAVWITRETWCATKRHIGLLSTRPDLVQSWLESSRIE